MSTQRIRIKDPRGGPDINKDLPLGAANAGHRGAASSAMSAPVANIADMTPIIKGRVLDLKHMAGGKEASKAFTLTHSPKPRA